MSTKEFDLPAADLDSLEAGIQITIRYLDGLTVHLYPAGAAPRSGVDETAVLLPVTKAVIDDLRFAGRASVSAGGVDYTLRSVAA